MTTEPTTTALDAPPAALPHDAQSLWNAARDGDPDATARLVERYGDDLLRVVRRRLPRRARSVLDSQDFLQSVWATVFRNGLDAGRFDSDAQLLAFLRKIASNKVADQVRRQLAGGKRDLNREVHSDAVDAAPGRRETPSQVSIARETLDRLLKGQPEHYRRIIEMKIAGSGSGEIAAGLGLHEGTVRRMLTRLSARIESR